MSKWLLSLTMLAMLTLASVGCGGDAAKPPEPDPNYKTPTDPSDLVIPDALNKPGN
jgi:hypothetical protein